MKNKIKQILKDRNMSILQLSHLANLNYPSTHRAVNNPDLSYTSISTMTKIANALNVKVEDLYEK